MAENRAWKKLPDEQGWWWFWTGRGGNKPFLVSILSSHSDEPFYFVNNSDSTRCDLLGGYWLKVEIPAPPTAVERADAEAVWLKRFQEVMAKDTAQVIADTQIDKERRGS